MDFIREEFYVGVSWFAINCILDILVLLPLAGMNMPTWFAQIGNWNALSYDTGHEYFHRVHGRVS